MDVDSLARRRDQDAGRSRGGSRLAALLFGLLGLTATVAMAQEPKPQAADGGHGSLAELGAKLSNPLSDVWALFTEFDVNWSEGDISDGEHKMGGDMLFQPVMPFKLNIIPVIPALVKNPIFGGG